MDKEEFYLNILKENWIHMRHQETQRMWIANIFVALVVGTSAYLTKSNGTTDSLFIPIVFLIISILCLLITLKLNKVFIETKQATINIFVDKKIFLGDGVNWNSYMGSLQSKGIWKVLRVRYLYVTLYIIGIVASLSLLVFICLSR